MTSTQRRVYVDWPMIAFVLGVMIGNIILYTTTTWITNIICSAFGWNTPWWADLIIGISVVVTVSISWFMYDLHKYSNK